MRSQDVDADSAFSESAKNMAAAKRLMLLSNASLFAVVALAQSLLPQIAAPGVTPARLSGFVAAAIFAAVAIGAARRFNQKILTTVFCVAFFGVIAVSAFSNDGLPAPTTPFLILAPLVVGMMTNWRAGLAALMVAIFAALGLYFSSTNGLAWTSTHSDSELALLSLSAIILASIAAFIPMFAYERLSLQMIVQAEAVNADLQSATDVLSKNIEDLQNYRAFARSVFENASEGIIACTEDGRLSVVNAVAKTLHGVDTNAVEPLAWRESNKLYYADGDTPLPEEHTPLQRALAGEVMEAEEIAVRSQDGETRIVLCRGAPLLDREGRKFGALVSMRDVTLERRQAAELERQNYELQLIFDHVSAAICFKDDDNRIIRLNAAAAKMMGVSEEAATGASLSEIVPAMARDAYQRDMKVIDSGKPSLKEIIRVPRRDGEERWVSTDRIPYQDEKTGKKYVFVTSQDISELVEANEQLQQANAELEGFARVASHDLQEPLRKLMIFCEFLERDLGDDINERSRADLAAILSASRRMHRLVKDILSLSRMSREIEVSVIDPKDSIRQALKDVAAVCASKRAMVIYDDMPLVKGEPTLLTQVFHNLLSNALKFHAEDERPRIRFFAETKDDRIVLGVEDNGIGIDPGFREKVFDPLTRLHGSDRYEGTGIGLAICRKAVEAMGGRIWVEPGAEAGSRFCIALPAARLAQERASA